MTEQEQNVIRLAEKVMGWKLLRHRTTRDFVMFERPDACNMPTWKGAPGGGNSWNPYVSIADAWMLAERLREIIPIQKTTQTFTFQLCQTGRPGGWHCSFTINDGDWSHQPRVEEAATACEAICVAALAALGAKP